MKYYYNGKLMRTSEHVYTHAVIDDEGHCYACRNGYANAEKAKQAMKKSNQSIKEYRDAIKAIEAGRNFYFVRFGNRTFKQAIKETNTIEHYEELIKKTEAYNSEIENLRIVELEAR